MVVLGLLLLAGSVPTSLITDGSGLPPAVPGGAPHPDLRRPPTTNAPLPTPIRHVFVVMLENAQQSKVLAHGPYERYLEEHYASASSYYAICHPSAPNYLAITSGKAWQCGSDAYAAYTSENIGDLAEKSGLSWRGYDESMPAPCDTNDSYPYAVKHDPFVYYSDIVSNRSECRSHVVPFTNWTADLANGSIPALAIFTPNLTDDGHDMGVAFADRWLHGWLSPLINDSFFSTSVFFIVYDESVNDGSGYNGTAGGHVYFSAVSPYARSGYLDRTNASNYDLLSTMEWLLGLGNSGHNDGTRAFPPLVSLFVSALNTSATYYTVAGTVTSDSDGSPVGGALVSLSGEPTETTNGTGSFHYSVPNGTYEIGATAPGYRPAEQVVKVVGEVVDVELLLAPVGPNETFAVAGAVRSALTGAALENATVAVQGGDSTTTNVDGNYSLSLPNGTYLVGASRDGYTPVEHDVRVAGTAVTDNFTLDPTGPHRFAVTGSVLSAATGAPLGGASVQATPGGVSGTNRSGGFRFDLGNGTHTLETTAPGFGPARLTIAVDGAPEDLTIHLEPNGTGAQPLDVIVSVLPSAPSVSTEITFLAILSGGVPPYTTAWTFGDGTRANGTMVQHAFTTRGAYPVVVVVHDAAGSTGVGEVNVTISDAPSGGEGPPPRSVVSSPAPSILLSPIVLAAVLAGGGVSVGVWLRRRHHR